MSRRRRGDFGGYSKEKFEKDWPGDKQELSEEEEEEEEEKKDGKASKRRKGGRASHKIDTHAVEKRDDDEDGGGGFGRQSASSASTFTVAAIGNGTDTTQTPSTINTYKNGSGHTEQADAKSTNIAGNLMKLVATPTINHFTLVNFRTPKYEIQLIKKCRTSGVRATHHLLPEFLHGCHLYAFHNEIPSKHLHGSMILDYSDS